MIHEILHRLPAHAKGSRYLSLLLLDVAKFRTKNLKMLLGTIPSWTLIMVPIRVLTFILYSITVTFSLLMLDFAKSEANLR